MKHCYTDCIVKSDDEYRTRFDCVICGKQFYQLKDRTTKVESKNDSLLVGSILLVNGTPHITCEGHQYYDGCKHTDRLINAKNIRIFLKWEEVGKEVVRDQRTGVRYIRTRYKPIIRQARGCENCANFQDAETQKIGKPHMFNGSNLPRYEGELPESTTKYA